MQKCVEIKKCLLEEHYTQKTCFNSNLIGLGASYENVKVNHLKCRYFLGHVMLEV